MIERLKSQFEIELEAKKSTEDMLRLEIKSNKTNLNEREKRIEDVLKYNEAKELEMQKLNLKIEKLNESLNKMKTNESNLVVEIKNKNEIKELNTNLESKLKTIETQFYEEKDNFNCYKIN